MSKVAVFFADGCEEIEGLTVVDMLRRAKIEVFMVSVMERIEIKGSHGIKFLTDCQFEEVDFSEFDAVVLPGGIPGTPNLQLHGGVQKVIREFAEQGKLVAAICAAPSILGGAGLLEGKRATCHPGWEEKLTGATVEEEKAVVDGNIITSRGMGTAVDFALAIISYLSDAETVADVRKGIVY